MLATVPVLCFLVRVTGQDQTTDRSASASGRGRYAGSYVGRARAGEAVAQRFWGERLRSRSILRALSHAGAGGTLSIGWPIQPASGVERFTRFSPICVMHSQSPTRLCSRRRRTCGKGDIQRGRTDILTTT